MILGVSFDTPEENRAFAEKFQFNFPLLCDTERTMGAAYGACEPGDTSGYAKRVGVILAPDGTVRQYLPKVDAKTFPDDALRML